MTRITEELASQIWDQGDHDWERFRRNLENNPQLYPQVNPELRRQLITLSKQMEVQGEGFPTSVQAFYHFLADHLGTVAGNIP